MLRSQEAGCALAGFDAIERLAAAHRRERPCKSAAGSEKKRKTLTRNAKQHKEFAPAPFAFVQA
jgi:hypothetical protein